MSRNPPIGMGYSPEIDRLVNEIYQATISDDTAVVRERLEMLKENNTTTLLRALGVIEATEDVGENIDRQEDPRLKELHSRALSIHLRECIGEAAGLNCTNVLRLFIDEERLPSHLPYSVNGGAPLITAAEFGFLESMKILLEFKTDVNVRNSQGETAIAKAMQPEIMQMLYDHGADLNICDINDETPIFTTVKTGYADDSTLYERLCWMLERGARINVVNRNGKTPLMFACCRGSLKSARALIKAGARMDMTDRACDGHIGEPGILYSALQSLSLEMVEMILDLAPTELLCKWKANSSILSLVLREEPTEEQILDILKCLIGRGWSLTGNFEKVIWPLRYNEDHSRYFLRHPLHHASTTGKENVMKYFIELYKERGASLDCDGGFTPLHQACVSGRPIGVRHLLAAGADPSIRETTGFPPVCFSLSQLSTNISMHVISNRRGGWFARDDPFRCFFSFLRHSDLHYVTDRDLNDVLFGAVNVLDTRCSIGPPAPPKNLALLAETLMLVYAAVFEACPRKRIVRNHVRLCKNVNIPTDDDQFTPPVPYSCAENKYWKYIMSPTTLKLTARDVLRQTLRTDLEEKIKRLPLPTWLQDYLNIPELDTLLNEFMNFDFVTYTL